MDNQLRLIASLRSKTQSIAVAKMEDNDQSHSINPHSMNPDKLDIDNDLDLLDTDVPKLSHEPLPALHALSLTEDVHKRDPPSQPRAYEPRAHAQPKGRFRFRRYYYWDRRTPRKASSIDQQKQDEDTEMADVENRRDYRGGGGGHRGGGYNKKRRFRGMATDIWAYNAHWCTVCILLI